MKKYVKPELFYERYEVSQHIADCGWEWRNYTNEQTCMAVADTQGELGNLPAIFTDKDYGCVATDYENYCYQPGADGIVLAVS